MEHYNKYTRDEIKKIIRQRKFEYHRVDLPYDLHTKGEDRASTRDLIFPGSLEGKTVLDIGCALGYMSFEAEKKGAKKVLGVELKESRFESANILKDILNSNVEFRLQDVIRNPPEVQFDIVLFLNVIHHIAEPFKVLRSLSMLAREQLIIEFPTLEDRKFKRTLKKRLPDDIDKYPLVGVSLTREGQTFVFSPSSIERSLTDHEKLFRKIEFAESPIKGRMVAFCRK